GSVWDPSGIRLGSVWDPSGIRLGSADMDSFRDGQSANPVSPGRRAALLIEEHQEEICRLWLLAVQRHVPAARHYGAAEILDHLLDLLRDIVATLGLLENEGAASDAGEIRFIGVSSSQHGRERATLEDFTVGNVVQ